MVISGMTMRQHKWYGPWCSFFQHMLDRANGARGISQSEFAYQAGVSQQIMHAYITGRVKPPLDSLEHFAGVLQLNDTDRQQFIWLAQQPYTPTLVWERLMQCEERLVQTAAHLANAEKEVVGIRSQLAEVSAELSKSQQDTLALATKLSQVQAEFFALSAQVPGAGG